MTPEQLEEQLFVASHPCGCYYGYSADVPGWQREAREQAIRWLRQGFVVRRIARAVEQDMEQLCERHRE